MAEGIAKGIKVTRRELVVLAVTSAGVVSTAVAQDSPEDQYKKNAAALEKVGLPMDSEPAFVFKV